MPKPQLLKFLNAYFHLILSHTIWGKEGGGWKYRPSRWEESERETEEGLERERGEGAGHLTEVEEEEEEERGWILSMRLSDYKRERVKKVKVIFEQAESQHSGGPLCRA